MNSRADSRVAARPGMPCCMGRRRIVIGAPAAPRAAAHARQADAECGIGPRKRARPAKAEQPRQAHHEQHAHHKQCADASQQMAKSVCERMTRAVHAGDINEGRLQRATRHHHADKAEPQPDRAGTAQAGAARQRRFHEAPEEREQPDGRPAEPAENCRMHARHQRITDAPQRNPSSLN